MLDLGVGSGRTAYTFAALARSYVGLDYSPRMIELARELIAPEDSVELAVGDARQLQLGDRRFDLVLFSYNGIDSVSHEDRLRILDEVRRVVEPGGHFFFSSHSLRWLPFRPAATPPRRGDLLRSTYRSAQSVRRALRLKRLNRSLDMEGARARGWTLTLDPAHDFNIVYYYVDPEQQLEQLEAAGFRPLSILDARGREVDTQTVPTDDCWLYYLCSAA